MFYELCAYISLGVHAKVYSGHYLRIFRVRGVPVSAGIQKGVRNSWRCGMAAGSAFSRRDLPLRRGAFGCGRGDGLAAWCGPAAMTALKMPTGLHSACGVRDCPVAIVAAASRLKPTRLAMPVCHSECRAAGILSAG